MLLEQLQLVLGSALPWDRASETAGSARQKSRLCERLERLLNSAHTKCRPRSLDLMHLARLRPELKCRQRWRLERIVDKMAHAALS